ncbi:uncharacterized protein BDR25DRAFT_348513 [Lindgomyces ingoldianus]|uniref:Uncharacterized protein n=1 Tax=Lindgomyces ingoldianus TaxID=673940 RepID=A0ACB6RHK2_9PLEO|nr:uncharacterized protein BDR25DRAFT_348513 [Lindgomyces ingoldianus]KAF2478253.1 hypothetical protein BDR25DRAFT_348513 [Lindgomyces ingoldianus]
MRRSRVLVFILTLLCDVQKSYGYKDGKKTAALGDALARFDILSTYILVLILPDQVQIQPIFLIAALFCLSVQWHSLQERAAMTPADFRKIPHENLQNLEVPRAEYHMQFLPANPPGPNPPCLLLPRFLPPPNSQIKQTCNNRGNQLHKSLVSFSIHITRNLNSFEIKLYDEGVNTTLDDIIGMKGKMKPSIASSYDPLVKKSQKRLLELGEFEYMDLDRDRDYLNLPSRSRRSTACSSVTCLSAPTSLLRQIPAFALFFTIYCWFYEHKLDPRFIKHLQWIYVEGKKDIPEICGDAAYQTPSRGYMRLCVGGWRTKTVQGVAHVRRDGFEKKARKYDRIGKRSGVGSEIDCGAIFTPGRESGSNNNHVLSGFLPRYINTALPRLVGPDYFRSLLARWIKIETGQVSKRWCLDCARVEGVLSAQHGKAVGYGACEMVEEKKVIRCLGKGCAELKGFGDSLREFVSIRSLNVHTPSSLPLITSSLRLDYEYLLTKPTDRSKMDLFMKMIEVFGYVMILRYRALSAPEGGLAWTNESLLVKMNDVGTMLSPFGCVEKNFVGINHPLPNYKHPPLLPNSHNLAAASGKEKMVITASIFVPKANLALLCRFLLSALPLSSDIKFEINICVHFLSTLSPNALLQDTMALETMGSTFHACVLNAIFKVGSSLASLMHAIVLASLGHNVYVLGKSHRRSFKMSGNSSSSAKRKDSYATILKAAEICILYRTFQGSIYETNKRMTSVDVSGEKVKVEYVDILTDQTTSWRQKWLSLPMASTLPSGSCCVQTLVASENKVQEATRKNSTNESNLCRVYRSMYIGLASIFAGKARGITFDTNFHGYVRKQAGSVLFRNYTLHIGKDFLLGGKLLLVGLEKVFVSEISLEEWGRHLIDYAEKLAERSVSLGEYCFTGVVPPLLRGQILTINKTPQNPIHYLAAAFLALTLVSRIARNGNGLIRTENDTHLTHLFQWLAFILFQYGIQREQSERACGCGLTSMRHLCAGPELLALIPVVSTVLVTKSTVPFSFYRVIWRFCSGQHPKGIVRQGYGGYISLRSKTYIEESKPKLRGEIGVSTTTALCINGVNCPTASLVMVPKGRLALLLLFRYSGSATPILP